MNVCTASCPCCIDNKCADASACQGKNKVAIVFAVATSSCLVVLFMFCIVRLIMRKWRQRRRQVANAPTPRTERQTFTFQNIAPQRRIFVRGTPEKSIPAALGYVPLPPVLYNPEIEGGEFKLITMEETDKKNAKTEPRNRDVKIRKVVVRGREPQHEEEKDIDLSSASIIKGDD
jgi:hypothetical protein